MPEGILAQPDRNQGEHPIPASAVSLSEMIEDVKMESAKESRKKPTLRKATVVAPAKQGLADKFIEAFTTLTKETVNRKMDSNKFFFDPVINSRPIRDGLKEMMDTRKQKEGLNTVQDIMRV